jgi:SAM-dependent methyltransferase
MTPPAAEITETLAGVPPGDALDLACGAGRHAVWLRDRGWRVTAVDLVAPAIESVTRIQADLERFEFRIIPNAWDAIVCWLYWQENLLPAIAAGARPGGIVALAGKISGRFATSLANYRRAFEGWRELAAGESDVKAFWIGRKSGGA